MAHSLVLGVDFANIHISLVCPTLGSEDFSSDLSFILSVFKWRLISLKLEAGTLF